MKRTRYLMATKWQHDDIHLSFEYNNESQEKGNYFVINVIKPCLVHVMICLCVLFYLNYVFVEIYKYIKSFIFVEATIDSQILITQRTGSL